jgi:hypothetical protein
MDNKDINTITQSVQSLDIKNKKKVTFSKDNIYDTIHYDSIHYDTIHYNSNQLKQKKSSESIYSNQTIDEPKKIFKKSDYENLQWLTGC